MPFCLTLAFLSLAACPLLDAEDDKRMLQMGVTLFLPFLVGGVILALSHKYDGLIEFISVAIWITYVLTLVMVNLLEICGIIPTSSMLN